MFRSLMLRSFCFALLILAGAKPALADCSLSIFKESPAVPDAQATSYDEMQQAVVTIQNYIRSAEEVLDSCVQLSSFSYNYYVGRLKSLANNINKQSDLFSAIASSSTMARN